MDEKYTDKVLEGEIVHDEREDSTPLPARRSPSAAAPTRERPAARWIDALVAIGGGLFRWFISASRAQPPGGGNGIGKRSGGRMRRRRGKRG